MPGGRVGERDAPLWFEIPNKLYGRQKELAAIRANLEQVIRGDARVVLMRGPAGLGKSSLISEIGGLLTQHRLYFGYGKFEQLAGNTPYSAVIQALRVLVRRVLTEREQVLLTLTGLKWTRLLEEKGPISPVACTNSLFRART